MPRTLFEDLGASARKEGPASLRALPFSLGVHLLAAAAVASLAVRPVASALSEPPPGTLIFPTATVAVARPVHASATARVRVVEARPRNAGSGGPPAVIPLADPVGVQPELPGDEPAPPCLVNCGDGSGGSEGPQGDNPSASGADDGAGTGIAPRPVGGDILAPVKVHDVAPLYPELARRAGIQGSVVVQCVIDESGRVTDARVLKGQFLLNEAALAAVRQWRYQPTRLNGRAIAVVMTVTVNFVQR